MTVKLMATSDVLAQPLSDVQVRALRFVCSYDGVYAVDVGHHLRPGATVPEAASKGMETLWGLVRKGLVQRKIQIGRRCGYFPTKAGRAVLQEAAE